jgi:hypothetical protein
VDGQTTKTHGRFYFYRNPSGDIAFLPTWHRANMVYAAKVLGRCGDEVRNILWSNEVDVVLQGNPWYRRYYEDKGRRRFTIHEAIMPGQTAGFNCVVPDKITDDDLFALLRIVGAYRGISPAKPLIYGQFEVVSIRRRNSPENE